MNNTATQIDSEQDCVLYKYGDVISPKGSGFRYRVIGPVCRLFDREELPYPSCSIYWQVEEVVELRASEFWRVEHCSLAPKALPGWKQPSWRRLENGKGIGKQLISDGACAWKGVPTYNVELIGNEMPEYDDPFSYQGSDHPYTCEASDTLKELMKNRRPMGGEEMRTVPRSIHILPLYSEKLTPEMKQWWYKNREQDNVRKEVA